MTEWDSETVRRLLGEIGKELGVKGKALFMAVRVAVSGRSYGPDLNTLLVLLGPAAAARRAQDILEKFHSLDLAKQLTVAAAVSIIDVIFCYLCTDRR